MRRMRLRTVIVSFVAAAAASVAGSAIGWCQPSNFAPASAPVASPVPSVPSVSPPAKPELTAETRGDIFMARKMYREAAEMYLRMPESSAIAWNKMGIAYHQLSQLSLARRHYERSVKLSPNYAEAINNLGTVAYAEKNYRRATNHYKKALKYSPDSASIHSNLGTAYFARKKYELAMESYQAALTLDPNVFEHRGSHGTVLQERSVTERAKFHFQLARLYVKGGQTERAMQYLRKALEEGYTERAKIAGDDAFAPLRDNPEFQALLKTEFRAL